LTNPTEEADTNTLGSSGSSETISKVAVCRPTVVGEKTISRITLAPTGMLNGAVGPTSE
jgi:hypothetical protein